MDAHDSAGLLALGSDASIAQLVRLAAGSGSVDGKFAGAVGVGHAEVAAEADYVVEAELAQEGEQPLVAEATIDQDGHPAARRQCLGQAAQAGFLEIVAPSRDLLLPDGRPDQRRRPAVADHQVEHQGRLIVMVEIGPVHRHQNVASLADLMRHPEGEAVPHVDARVAHRQVHLLDRMLGDQAMRLRQRLANGRKIRQPRPVITPSVAPASASTPLGHAPRVFADEAPNVPQMCTRNMRIDHAATPSLAALCS